jgi:hypothetical protein
VICWQIPIAFSTGRRTAPIHKMYVEQIMLEAEIHIASLVLLRLRLLLKLEVLQIIRYLSNPSRTNPNRR